MHGKEIVKDRMLLRQSRGGFLCACEGIATNAQFHLSANEYKAVSEFFGPVIDDRD
ncbi:hypothetical protein [Microbacterium paraoxydans]|uniref:hypothetical protein n=1 Tax=Microbacterium paraoxydans TaxID=199592 RepID=UPI0021A8DE6D|nr:hypothetical protein [Microbacterium paraoxydans]MCT2222545.1 hypothetical protein [Microbacterium paraoxydans]